MEIQHKNLYLLFFSFIICISIKIATCEGDNDSKASAGPLVVPKSIDIVGETQQKTVKKDLEKQTRTGKEIPKPLMDPDNDSKQLKKSESMKVFPGNYKESDTIETDDKKDEEQYSLFPEEKKIDLPESYKTGFIYFFGITTAAVFVILLKLYSMRLTRAYRKYGVQGNRTLQELTPLPVSTEDGNSDDEEDQTVFQINRNVGVV